MELSGDWNFFGAAIDFSGEDGSTATLQSWYDPDELSVMRRLCRPGDRALVAGGGLGAVSLLVAARLGMENVVTYEANPYLAQLAQHNISHQEQSLDVRHAALGTRTGSCHLHVSTHWPLSSTRPDMVPWGIMLGSIDVPSIDINEALKQDNLNALLLDIEGGELDILPSLNYDLLRLLVVELHGPESAIAEARGQIAAAMSIECEVVKSPAVRVVGAVRGAEEPHA